MPPPEHPTDAPFARMGTTENVAYTRRIDRIVYGRDTAGFGRPEWVGLALAALDQAGLSETEIENVKRVLPPRAREEW